MPAAKPISKNMCLTAMDKTKSVKSAARYLNCSYHHLKRYMKLYVDEESGKTLFDKHKNQQGKGIPKFLRAKGKEPALKDIVEGKIIPSSFSPDKLKYRLITEGYLEECCGNCGFTEHRITDHKVPLILHFKDKNKLNYRLNNIEFLCYNCYFLFIGEVFTKRDIKKLEDNKSVTKTTDAVDMQLDDYHLKRLRELGLDGENPTDDDDPYNLVSYR
jgi:5-methylcytosine-specific restriction endonuclease McrA